MAFTGAINVSVGTMTSSPLWTPINLKETFNHDINDLLKETLEHEKAAISVYYKLLELVEGKSVYLEEYARSMIGQEELHALEVEKMLKK